MSTALENAKAYAAAGWYVFPLRPNTNVPYGGVEFKAEKLTDDSYVTKDLARIDQLSKSEKYRGCNWAVHCGLSGITVIDIDIKDGKDGRLALPALNLDTDTFTVRTPTGGYHHYYVGESNNTQNGKLGIGIDSRGYNGYVPVPGSTRPEGAYETVNQQKVLPLPEHILTVIQKAKVDKERQAQVLCDLDLDHNVQTAINYLTDTAPEAVQGDRDNTCYEVACRVRDFGISREKARELVREHYAEKVQLSEDFGYNELDWKVRSAYQYARNAVGTATPEALFPALPTDSSGGVIKWGDKLQDADIKARDWIMQDRLIRGYMTLTAAPGGVGKSLLSILEGVSIATGRALTHDEVKEQCRVWYYNTEDPDDELDRRVDAVKKTYGLTSEDLKDFGYSSGYRTPLKLAGYDDKGRPVVYENIVQYLIDTIKAENIGCLIIDPLVEIHSLNENSNTDMPVLMQALRRIADETYCAISLVHHTSQGSMDAAGNADKTRGATAIPNACRVTHTLFTMDLKAADRYNIIEAYRWKYLRLDTAKQNMAPPGLNTRWFERSSYKNVQNEHTGVLKTTDLMEVETECEFVSAAYQILPNCEENRISLFKLSEEIKAETRSRKDAKTIKGRLLEYLDENQSISGYVLQELPNPNGRGSIRELVR